jgi:hypothetical protein
MATADDLQFQRLTTSSALAFVDAARERGSLAAASPSLASEASSAAWVARRAVEVSDGNLNFVFRVDLAPSAGGGGGGGGGDAEEVVSVCVKQAPPFIKVVPQFGLPQSRVVFEARYARACNAAAARCFGPQQNGGGIDGTVRFAPEVLDTEALAPPQGAVVTEWLQGHEVLRGFLSSARLERAFVVPGGRGDGGDGKDGAGGGLQLLSRRMGDYLAAMMFCTSSLGLSRDDKLALEAQFAGNSEMCRLTAQVCLFVVPTH